MMRAFSAAGFSVESVVTSRFETLPLRRASLAAEFRSVSDEDLMVSGFHVVLRAPGSSTDRDAT